MLRARGFCAIIELNQRKLFMRNLFRSVPKRKTIPFFAGLALALLTLVGGVGFSVHKVSAADYSGNAIMYGGFSSASGFIQQIKNNDSGRHSDLAAVYANYGLTSADYNKFVTYSLPGTDYRDGHITVQNNGQEMTVATGVKSIGRQLGPQGSGAFSQVINGVTYYGNSNDKAFAAGISSLPVQVFFSAQGIMQFAVIKDCGNPTHGTSVVPSAECRALNMTKSSTQANTYSFSANVTQNENLFTKFVYNFGDGTSQTTTNPSTVVSHTYKTAGNFQVSVTPYVKLPGNPERPISVGPCVHTISIVMPYQSCVNLVPAIVDKSKYIYKVTVNLKYGNGSTPTKAAITFGDGQTATLTSLASNTSYVTTHTYPNDNRTYNLAASVSFTSNGTTVTAPTCTAMIPPNAQPPVSTCKPGIPVGDVRCNPCPTNPSVPATDTQNCQTPPPSLPNTGAGNTIAIFAAVVIAGFLVYRTVLYRRHKAAFVAAQMGTSPLPLGDPLSDTPLTGTPLASKLPKSFRRKRQF